jgi:hypothetical protein
VILAFAAVAVQAGALQSLSTADLTSICALSARETLRRGMGGHSPIGLDFRLVFLDDGVGRSIKKAVHDRLREWKSQMAPVGQEKGVSWLTIRILDRAVGRVVVRAEAEDTHDTRIFFVSRGRSGWKLAKVDSGFASDEAEQLLISASTFLSRELHPERPLFVSMDRRTRSLEPFNLQSPKVVPVSILSALRGQGFKPRTDASTIVGLNAPPAYDTMELLWPYRLDDDHGYVFADTSRLKTEQDGFKAFEAAEWGVLVTKRGKRWVASESYSVYSE